MKLKWNDIPVGGMYIDLAECLCVKLSVLGNESAQYAAVLAYHPEDRHSEKPLHYLFNELVDREFVIPNSFDIKRYFPED